jgi:hypothetical protein
MNREEVECFLKGWNNIVLSGNTLQAFDKYYDDDVVGEENDVPPAVSNQQTGRTC